MRRTAIASCLVTTAIQAISRPGSIGGPLVSRISVARCSASSASSRQSECRRAIRLSTAALPSSSSSATRARSGSIPPRLTTAARRARSAAAASTPGSIPAAAATPPATLSSARDEHLPDQRRRRIPGLAHVRSPAGEGHRVICVDNLDTGSLQNIEHIRDDAFELHPARPHRAVLHRRADRLRLSPRFAGEPDRLPAPAAAHAQGRLLRHPPHARAGEEASVPASCSPRPPRSTATPRSTRSRRPTGATSTRSARAASTTRPSATPRR